jgi:hypothetical protein
MEDKKHLFGVGAIVLNLQSLELHLRYFLARMHQQDPVFPKIGDPTAAVNYLTVYKSLTALEHIPPASNRGDSQRSADERFWGP